MPRKSTITRLAPDQRAFVEKLIREDRHTLDEMMRAIREKYPETEVSRSGLHRYQAGFSEMVERMREIDRMAQVVVGELGEGVGEKAGALLAQSITTLANNAAMRAQERDDISVDEVRKLARAAKDAIDTRRISLKERQAIAAAARERLLAEQKAKLDQVVKDGGLSEDTANTLRRKILGLK